MGGGESTLEAVAEALATACSGSTEPRTLRAIELWNNHQQRVDVEAWQRTSGLGAEALERFDGQGISPRGMGPAGTACRGQKANQRSSMSLAPLTETTRDRILP